MAWLEARRQKDVGAERHPSLLVAHSPPGSTLADGAAHDAKSSPDRWRRAAGKTLSAALFVSMWVVPPLIHRAGFRCDACPHPRLYGVVCVHAQARMRVLKSRKQHAGAARASGARALCWPGTQADRTFAGQMQCRV
jgi:hypothetical protein